MISRESIRSSSYIGSSGVLDDFVRFLLLEMALPPHGIICLEICQAFSPIGSMNMVVYSITYKNIVLFENLDKKINIHVGKYAIH